MIDCHTLTRDKFEEFKADFPVYGTHNVTDKYLNERAVRDDEPKAIIHTMWHPATDNFAIAEYGKNVNKILYCILFDDPGIAYNDIILLRDTEFEVVGIKKYNTHTRVEVKMKKVDINA